MFFNLYGDAKKSKKQVKFIQKVSVLSIVFITKSEINDTTTQLINNLAENNKTILFVEKNCEGKITTTSLIKMSNILNLVLESQCTILSEER